MELYTVIAKKGEGKTTFIKKLASELSKLDLNYQVLFAPELTEKHAFHNKQAFISLINHIAIEIVGEEQTYEAFGILYIKDKKIGIYTAGDYVYNLRDAMCFFINNDCDIGIHASRPGCMYIDCIDEMCKLIKNKYEINIIKNDLLRKYNIEAVNATLKTISQEKIKEMAKDMLK